MPPGIVEIMRQRKTVLRLSRMQLLQKGSSNDINILTDSLSKTINILEDIIGDLCCVQGKCRKCELEVKPDMV